MRIATFALAVLVFSAVVTMFNTLDVFNYKVYEPGYTINRSDADGIYEIEEPQVETKQGVLDKVADVVGFEAIYNIWKVVKKALGMALNIGGLVSQYVPGDVGEQFAILINAVTYFVYAWGGVQLWRKVSSKNMD